MMTKQGHAAMLQFIAEGMRSPAAGQLSAEQRERVAGLLDRIAVDLLMPVADDDESFAAFLEAPASAIRQLDS